MTKRTGQFYAPERVTFDRLCQTCDIGCLTVMLDREQLADVFMEYIDKEDYATWVRIFRRNGIVASKYPGILACYRLSKHSLSSNKLREIKKQYQVLRKVGDLSAIAATGCLLLYILNGFTKHLFHYRS